MPSCRATGSSPGPRATSPSACRVRTCLSSSPPASRTTSSARNRWGKRTVGAYTPNEDDARIYDELFAEYTLLHDYFGRGTNDVMHRLKDVCRRALTVGRPVAALAQVTS